MLLSLIIYVLNIEIRIIIRIKMTTISQLTSKTHKINEKRLFLKKQLQQTLKSHLGKYTKPQNNISQKCNSFQQKYISHKLPSDDSQTESQDNMGQFQEKYEFLGQIGMGSQSIVYKYRNRFNGKQVAVKVIRKAGQQIINSVTTTYQLMKGLQHDNILKVENLYINQELERCQIISQFYDAKNLKQYLVALKAQNIQMSEHEVCLILRKLFETLIYLKEKGVCHNDIKPENILYDPKNGFFKLIDFDVSKQKSQSEEKLEICGETGTLYYRAPETFQNFYDERVDMWAVGVVAFQMIKGCLPFRRNSAEDTISLILNSNVKLDDQNINSELLKIVESSLERDQKRRLTPEEGFAILASLEEKENSEKSTSSFTSTF